WAERLGLLDSPLALTQSVQSATGQTVRCKTMPLDLELRREDERIAWIGEIAVAEDQVRRPHWGHKGFLEYFSTDFNGPSRIVTLVPADRPSSLGRKE